MGDVCDLLCNRCVSVHGFSWHGNEAFSVAVAQNCGFLVERTDFSYSCLLARIQSGHFKVLLEHQTTHAVTFPHQKLPADVLTANPKYRAREYN